MPIIRRRESLSRMRIAFRGRKIGGVTSWKEIPKVASVDVRAHGRGRKMLSGRRASEWPRIGVGVMVADTSPKHSPLPDACCSLQPSESSNRSGKRDKSTLVR